MNFVAEDGKWKEELPHNWEAMRRQPTLVEKFSCTSKTVWKYHDVHELLLLEHMGLVDPLQNNLRADLIAQMKTYLNQIVLDDDCGALGKGCGILDKYGYSGWGLYYQKHVDFAIQDGKMAPVGNDIVDEGSGKPWLDDICQTSSATIVIEGGEVDVTPGNEFDYRCHCPDPEMQGGGNLTITVLEARGLPHLDGFGLAGGDTDAYLKIKIGNSVRTTSFARNSNNPRWQSEYEEYLHEKQLENSYCRFIHDRFQESHKWTDGDCEQDMNFDYNKGCSVEDHDACHGAAVNFGIKQSGADPDPGPQP